MPGDGHHAAAQLIIRIAVVTEPSPARGMCVAETGTASLVRSNVLSQTGDGAAALFMPSVESIFRGIS
jgi:hypothetical protein